jgi:hypothetical protein
VKCVVFFGLFKEAFGKSDKKTFKDNLSPFFGTNEMCGEFIKSSVWPKFEDKLPEKWNDIFNMINDENEKTVRVLTKKEEAKFL